MVVLVQYNQYDLVDAVRPLRAEAVVIASTSLLAVLLQLMKGLVHSHEYLLCGGPEVQ